MTCFVYICSPNWSPKLLDSKCIYLHKFVFLKSKIVPIAKWINSVQWVTECYTLNQMHVKCHAVFEFSVMDSKDIFKSAISYHLHRFILEWKRQHFKSQLFTEVIRTSVMKLEGKSCSKVNLNRNISSSLLFVVLTNK